MQETNISINNLIMYLRKSRSDDPYMTVEEVLARHEQQLQDYALSSFGAVLPEEKIFREVVSGETISDRPVMQNVMKYLETGLIKGVLVIEPQRLSRGDLEDCGRIINTFRYTDTLVITPPKIYNLSDEYDRKFFEMELTRGNDYLEYTKKILNRGRIASVKQGNFIGTIPPYGYRKVMIGSGKNTRHTLEIIPEQAEAVRLMFHLFVDEGYGFTRIARYLDRVGIRPLHSECWNPASLKDILENPVYIGKIRWNWRKTQKKMVNGQIIKTRPKTKDSSAWIYVDGIHEPIIDEKTYQAALDRRTDNPRIRKGTELKNPYAGLLFCGTCGRAMNYKRTHNKKYGSICENMLCSNQANCHTHSVKFSTFQERVITSLKETIADFEIKLEEDNGSSLRFHMAQVNRLRSELDKLKEKDERQKNAYENGIYTMEEFAPRNAKLQEQICQMQQKIRNMEHAVPEAIDYKEKIMRFRDCLDALQDPDISAEEKNSFLKSCIDKIMYYNDLESRSGIGRYIQNEFRLDIFLRL